MRKLAVAMMIGLMSRDRVYQAIGKINKRWPFLHSVFVMYPAAKHYQAAYTPEWVAKRYHWTPVWVGVGRQAQGRWMMIFAIPNLEQEFHDSRNKVQLMALNARMNHIQNALGVSQRSFAGVLPSAMAAQGVRFDAPEADVTVMAVKQAIEQVCQQEQLPAHTPLIILGGAGFIGRRVVAHYQACGHEVAVVDPVGEQTDTWPHHWQGRRAIVLNLTRKYALEQYIPFMWRNLVLLNEVYPAPRQAQLEQLAEQGCPSYHIVGVHGRAWPSFPASYAGAIPCCAGQPDFAPKVLTRQLAKASTDAVDADAAAYLASNAERCLG